MKGNSGDSSSPPPGELLPPPHAGGRGGGGGGGASPQMHLLELSPFTSPMRQRRRSPPRGGGGGSRLGEVDRDGKYRRLWVELVEAKEIFSKRPGEELVPFGVLHCFGERKRAGNIYRSVLNPFWGENHGFVVQEGCRVRKGDRVNVKIFAENGKGKDAPLGEVDVDVNRAKEEEGEELREWFPLVGYEVGGKNSFIDGELQLFLGMLSYSSMLVGSGKGGAYLHVHIGKLRNFWVGVKKAGLAEIFVKFQVL